MKSERELFEAWAKKETNWDLYWSENIKQYMDHQTNGAWFAWIASAQREGYKLVPVEPSEEMYVRQILEVLNDENLFYENKCDTIKEILK